MRIQAEVGVEEEGVEVEVAEVAEGRPAQDANPWLSLPQRQRQQREGQTVFHERHEVP